MKKEVSVSFGNGNGLKIIVKIQNCILKYRSSSFNGSGSEIVLTLLIRFGHFHFIFIFLESNTLI